MKKFDKSKLVLPIICAVSAILLAIVNFFTSPRIIQYENSLTENALKEVSSGYNYGNRIDVTDNSYVCYYHQLFNGDKTVGYIVGLKSTGYGGQITLVSSLDTSGKILAVKMISNNETPGVGKKSENEGYMNMFIGKGSSIEVPVTKNMLSEEELSVVSGATLTFGGISKALKAASDFVKTL